MSVGLHFEEYYWWEFLVEEEGLFYALDDVLAWAHRPEVLDHLFSELLLVQHNIMNKVIKIIGQPHQEGFWPLLLSTLPFLTSFLRSYSISVGR